MKLSSAALIAPALPIAQLPINKDETAPAPPSQAGEKGWWVHHIRFIPCDGGIEGRIEIRAVVKMHKEWLENIGRAKGFKVHDYQSVFYPLGASGTIDPMEQRERLTMWGQLEFVNKESAYWWDVECAAFGWKQEACRTLIINH